MAEIIPIESLRGRKPKPPRRLTPELLWELLRIHAQCPLDQMGKCALTVFLKPLCWEINQAMGLANEEDKGFRRCDPMCAAKPLGERHGAIPVRTVYGKSHEELE